MGSLPCIGNPELLNLIQLSRFERSLDDRGRFSLGGGRKLVTCDEPQSVVYGLQWLQCIVATLQINHLRLLGGWPQ